MHTLQIPKYEGHAYKITTKVIATKFEFGMTIVVMYTLEFAVYI